MQVSSSAELPPQRVAHLQNPEMLVLQPASLPELQKHLLASRTDPLVLRALHTGSQTGFQTGSQTGQVPAQTHLEMAPVTAPAKAPVRAVARESIAQAQILHSELSFGKTALEEPPEEALEEVQWEEQEAQWEEQEAQQEAQ